LHWTLLAATYLSALETIHVLWTGRASLDRTTIVKVLVVPATQLAALEIVEMIRKRQSAAPSRDRVAWFFVLWVVLAVALLAASTMVDLIVARRFDLTEAAAFLFLLTPALQASVLSLRWHGAQRLLDVCRAVVGQPLARPVLWLDAIILSVGCILIDQPIAGLAVAGLLQRRWMGTKLIAAAMFAAACAIRRDAGSERAGARFALLGTAVILGAIGVDTFTPWISARVVRLLGAVAGQQTLVATFELYAAILIVLLSLSLSSRHAVGHHSRHAESLVGAGAVTLFLATLMLGMNGFMSLQPVQPWAGLALTGGSVAASLFLVGFLLALTSHKDDETRVKDSREPRQERT